jgi:hypothetical protein
MMDVHALRGWLLRQPRPVTIRIVTPDQQHHELTIDGSWQSAAESVLALGPELVQALDGQGKLLRAVRPAEEARDQPGSSPSTVASTPLPPNADPQTVMLSHFADLLAAAYRHSTEVAFDRMVSLFEAVNRRSEALERSLDTTHRLLRKAWEEQVAAAADKETDPLTEMVGAFMGGQQAGASETHPSASNGAANGSAKG